MRRVLLLLSALGGLAPSCDEPVTCAEPWPAWTGDRSGCDPDVLPDVPPAPVSVPLPGDVTAVLDLSYDASAGVALLGDLYLPGAVRADRGAIVVLHGGGWEDCGRRRDAVGETAYGLALLLGVPVFNVEYRLRQEGGGYPGNVRDVACAARFLADAAAEYGFDPDRIALVGESAGAHLALITPVVGDREAGACGPLPPITGVVAVSPVTDLPRLVRDGEIVAGAATAYTDSDCLQPVDTCAAVQACDRCVDASPLAHACTYDEELLVVQAPEGYDPLLPNAPMADFVQAVQLAGGTAAMAVPTADALAAAGCPAGTPVHGFTPCLTTAAGAEIAATLERALTAP
ncbi:MAG: alpha/beta hydrolase [Myxococcota bacterium]